MKKWLLLLLKISITLGLFYWFISKIDFSAINIFKHEINLSALIIAAVWVAIQFFTGMFRWCVILPLFNVKQPTQRASRIYWIGMFFNACLPTGIAGDALRVRLMQQPEVTVTKLINVVFLERLIGVLILLLMVEVSMIFFKPPWGHVAVIHLFQLIILGGLVGFIFLSYMHRLPIPWHRLRLLQMIYQLSLDTHTLWQFPLQTMLMFITTVTGVTSQILAIYFLTRGLHLSVSLIDCFLLVPSVILAMSLPISIGGWGIREGAMITFLGWVGVSAAAAFSLSVLFGMMMLLVYLPGGIFWILWRKEKVVTEDETLNNFLGS